MKCKNCNMCGYNDFIGEFRCYERTPEGDPLPETQSCDWDILAAQDQLANDWVEELNKEYDIIDTYIKE